MSNRTISLLFKKKKKCENCITILLMQNIHYVSIQQYYHKFNTSLKYVILYIT
jgi:hypothetical protein